MLSKEQMLDLWAAWWLKPNYRGASGSDRSRQCQRASLLSVNGDFCRAVSFTGGHVLLQESLWSTFLVRSIWRDAHIDNPWFKILLQAYVLSRLAFFFFFNLADCFQILPKSFFFFLDLSKPMCLFRYGRALGLQDLGSTMHWSKHLPSSRQLDTEYPEKMMVNHVENSAICISTMISR